MVMITMIDSAAARGDINTVKYLIQNGTEITKKTIDLACLNKHFKIAAFLYLNTSNPVYSLGLSANFIILIENVNVCIETLELKLTKSDDDKFVLESVYTDAKRALEVLEHAESVTAMYQRKDVLEVVYLGSEISERKYACLVREHISKLFTSKLERLTYFTYCKSILSILKEV